MALDQLCYLLFGLVTIGLDVRPLMNENGGDADAIWRRICAPRGLAAEGVAGSSRTEKRVDRASRDLSIDVQQHLILIESSLILEGIALKLT